MWFSSDNTGPAHPAVLEAIAAANAGDVASYGAEAGMERVTVRIRQIFEAPEAEVRLVATGTAANALALATYCPPWGTILCHRTAHVEMDECGAPAFYAGGAKLTLVDGADGRIDPDALAEALAAVGRGGVHGVQRGVVSLTNATELGTVYDPDALARLSEPARSAGWPVHLDGARFANAVAALGCSPAEASWRAGVDVLSLGGTKNGLLGVEAVVFFDPAARGGRTWEFELRRKRGGHLFSKHRFLSAQMEAYLADGLWLDLARTANARAATLAAGLAAWGDARILHPVEANMIFATWPRAAHRAVQAAGAHYYLWPFDQALEGPDEARLSARLVCHWATEPAAITGFLQALQAPPV